MLVSSLLLSTHTFKKKLCPKQQYLKWLEGSLPKEQVKQPHCTIGNQMEFLV